MVPRYQSVADLHIALRGNDTLSSRCRDRFVTDVTPARVFVGQRTPGRNM
ncbi:MAG: hypothetical protein JWN72_1085 [Thermoleophilia bacterium]|nr:hypothetical protein [Thermoleophilia bacterium]